MASIVATERRKIIFNPPDRLFGTLDPEHDSNFYRDEKGEIAKDKAGNRLPVKEEDRGMCHLFAILKATPYRADGFAPWKAENSLKLAVRSGMDKIKAGERPLTEEQAEEILWRLYTGPKDQRGGKVQWLDPFLPILEDAERYLVAYLGGEEIVARWREASGFKIEPAPKTVAEIRAEMKARIAAEDEAEKAVTPETESNSPADLSALEEKPEEAVA